VKIILQGAIKIIGIDAQGIDATLLSLRANLEMTILFSLALIVTMVATGAFASRAIMRVDPMTALRE